MTPKEKANQLVDQFWDYQWNQNTLRKQKHMSMTFAAAIHCALITANEIGRIVILYNDTQHEAMYWQEVKQELEKL